MRRRSSAVGLAVPMSMPRYSAIESSEMISAPICPASSIPTAVLPDAVEPVRNHAAPTMELDWDMRFPVDSANLSDYRNIFPLEKICAAIDDPSRPTHFGTADGGDRRPQGESPGQIVHYDALYGRSTEDWRENPRGSRGGDRGGGRTGG